MPNKSWRKVVAAAVVISSIALPIASGASAQVQKSGRFLSLELAMEAASEAIRVCSEKGWPVSVSIVDAGGNVKVQAKGDFSAVHTKDASFRKAYTTVSYAPLFHFNRLSDWVEALRTNPLASSYATLPNIFLLPGAVAVKDGDEVIAAIGVGGAPGAKRTKCARRRASQKSRTASEFCLNAKTCGLKTMTKIHVNSHEGSRLPLLPLFRLADESEVHIRSYFEIGQVLVARDEGSIIGIVQIAKEPESVEIVSLAVVPERQRQGTGTTLIGEAINYCHENSITRLIVCTGSWEVDNIAFYLRRGFRIFNVARDFFTPEKGYTLSVRDQVQFEMDL